MLRRSLLILAAISVSPVARADWFSGSAVRGSGALKTESRDVGAFTGVALALSGVVDLRQGDKESVTVETDDNILPLIETVVESGTLRIRYRNKSGGVKATSIRIVVTARTIDALTVAGTGDIRADRLQAKSLTATISGSGEIHIGALDATSFKANISGSGDLTVAGRTDTLQGNIAGSGNLQTGKLEARTASLRIAGSGYARVWARETLAVSSAGSGDVDYYGSPTLTRSVAGSGTIKRLGPGPG